MSAVDLFEHVKNGEFDSAKDLVSADPSLVNERDDVGATPLHYAALNGDRETARMLVDHGADVNSRDTRFGATPSGWAIELYRDMGGLLGVEIDDMAHAINRNDAEWVTRLLGRFPALRDAVTSEGTPLRELSAKCSDEQIKAIFNASKS